MNKSAIQLSERTSTYFVSDSLHINKNGAYTAIWQLSPVNQLNLDEGDFDSISAVYYKLLEQLPPNTEVQLMYDKYVKSNSDLSISEVKTENERAQFYSGVRSDFIKESTYYQTDIFLSVTFNHLLDKYKHNQAFFSYFLDKKTPKQTSKKNFKETLEEIEPICETIENAFSFVDPYRLNSSQIVKLLSNFYNFESDFEEDVIVSDEYFTRDMFKRAYGVDKTGFAYGKDFVSVISMYELPTGIVCPVINNNILASPLKSFLDVDLEYKVILNIDIEDTKQAASRLKNIDLKVNKALSTINSIAQRRVLELEGFNDEDQGLIVELEMEEELLCNISFNIIFKSETKKTAKRYENLFLSQFSAFNSSKAIVESQDALNVFFSLAPGNFLNATRYFPIRGSAVATLINLTSQFQGHETGITYKNRDNKVVLYDIFNSESNYNGFIVGPSGKGKSYTMNDMIKKYYEQNVKFVILDVAGSYRKITEDYQGDYVDINQENPTYIDPFFYFNPSLNEEEHGKNLFILQSFVEIMLLRSDINQQDLPKDHKGVINNSIESFFKTVNKETNIHEFYNYIKNDDVFFGSDIEAKTYALRVIEYYTKSFKAFFDPANENKLKFDSDSSILCFDLLGIEGVSDLEPLFAFLITHSVNEMNSRDNNRFIFVLDEAWKFLQQSEKIADYAEFALRTFRKTNGSIILITQNIRDLSQGKIKDAMVNCNTKFLLHHDKDHEVVQENLNMTPNELTSFKNLAFNKNIREILISSNGEPIVVSLVVSKHDAWMSTTNPKDLIVIEEAKQRHGGDMNKAIDELAKQDA